ncbi:MAG: DUF488 domain-containing protein [Dehalococcoidia bacterium]|nr:DUF488 domain-containing protein [Dehalococcoidia bacterium]
MKIYTIGFTKKPAEIFFDALRSSGAKYLLDIRLHNNSQLAGFTKRDDLKYFLKNLTGIEYYEMPVLAPDDAILKEYRKTNDWTNYERKYLDLITKREAENHIPNSFFEQGVVLLCSEPKPDRCHRRLAAEYLAQKSPNGTSIIHL